MKKKEKMLSICVWGLAEAPSSSDLVGYVTEDSHGWNVPALSVSVCGSLRTSAAGHWSAAGMSTCPHVHMDKLKPK